MARRKRRCSQCKELVDIISPNTTICDCCLEKMGLLPKQRTFVRDFPEDWTMSDKIAKARELGMSYGKFVALVHDRIIDITTLEKPKKLYADPRKYEIDWRRLSRRGE